MGQSYLPNLNAHVQLSYRGYTRGGVGVAGGLRSGEEFKEPPGREDRPPLPPVKLSLIASALRSGRGRLRHARAGKENWSTR